MGTYHALEWPPLPRRRPAAAAAEPRALRTGLLRPRPRPVVRPELRPATRLVGVAEVGRVWFLMVVLPPPVLAQPAVRPAMGLVGVAMVGPG